MQNGIRHHQAPPQPDFWLRLISTSSSFQFRVKEASLSGGGRIGDAGTEEERRARAKLHEMGIAP